MNLADRILDRLDKPVLTLEVRRYKLVGQVRLGLIIWAVLVALLVLGYIRGLPNGTVLWVLVGLSGSIGSLLLMIGISVSAIRSIISEREQGTLETLVITPLRSGEIIDQKAAAVMLRSMPYWLSCATVAGALAFAILRSPGGFTAFGASWLFALLPLLVVWAAVTCTYVCLWLSCCCKQASTGLLIFWGAYLTIGQYILPLAMLGLPLTRYGAVRAFEGQRRRW